MNAPSLVAWQSAFTAYLQHGVGEDWLSAQTTVQDIAPELRLGVYRHAYYPRLEESLAHDFPALRAALADDDFGRLMAGYLRAHPSTSPTLRDLGQMLPAWLRTQGKLEHADLAAIEWTVLNAFDAADVPPLDAGALAQIAPQEWVSLRVRLQPSLTLLALNSNAADYWQAQRSGDAPVALMLSAGGWLVIARGAEGPVYVNISEAQYEIMARLGRGETVATVCSGMLAHVVPKDIPQFVAETFARIVASGWACEE